MNQEIIKQKIEQAWRERVKAQGLPTKGQKYLKAEVEFFVGAMSAVHAMDPNATPDRLSRLVPPAWVFSPLSGRPIVEDHSGG